MVDQHERLRHLPPGELIARLSSQIVGLLHSEATLAEHELRGKARILAGAVALAAAGALVAFMGSIAMIVTVMVLLQMIMPLWGAALVAMIVAFGLAGIFALAARALVMKASPLLPERTLQSLKEDLAWAKTRLSSNSE